MGIIVVLVFLGVFAVIALVLTASSSGAAQQAKQVHATLDSALATDSRETTELIGDIRKKVSLSNIPWLNTKLVEFDIAERLQAMLYQADLKWSPGSLITGCALLFVVAAYIAYWRFESILIALPVGLAAGASPFLVVMAKRSKRLNRFQEGLPSALDLMVSALRAGHSLVAAMGSVARECADPIGTEFRACFDEQNFGLDLKTALDNLLERVPLQDLRIVSTALLIQRESGGNLAEVLDKTSHVIRERFRLKRQVSVHTAQGRMTGWVLTFLPVVLGFLLYLVNPVMMSLLWTTAVGVKLLWTSFVMLIIGGLIIRKIVNMDV